MKIIITLLSILAMPFLLIAQDNTFNGPGTDWDTPSNWSTGKVPSTDNIQKITIASDCIVSNSNDYTFFAGSIFRIEAGVTFTNNGTGSWIMEGLIDKEGVYIGDLIIKGNIAPGDNATTWSCGDDLIYAGQTYPTVQIGGQCWMAKSLNLGTMIHGSNSQANNNIIEKYCYGNNSSNCDTYGAIYQWNELMQYTTIESAQGLCPTGWHLPSDNEWISLEEELGMCSGSGSTCSHAVGQRGTNQGSQMTANAVLWNNGDLENDPEFGDSGLNLLPAGNRLTNGSIIDQNNAAILWSSTQNGSTAWYRHLSHNRSQVGRAAVSKSSGFSARCIKD